MNVPGFTGSGPRHWQSLWEQNYSNFYRVQQKDWDYPHRSEWVEGLDRFLADFPAPVILVGHSLGCITIIHWITGRFRDSVKAAFLVAPSDPRNPNFPEQAMGFDELPTDPLPVPSVLVAGSDDPYLSLDRASSLADSWGSTYVNIGHRGHINSDSDLGMWEEGKNLLDELSDMVTDKPV